MNYAAGRWFAATKETAMLNLLIAATVSYQITTGLPLKHDGYVVEKTGSGENAEFVVKAAAKRAFLYANYERSLKPSLCHCASL